MSAKDRLPRYPSQFYQRLNQHLPRCPHGPRHQSPPHQTLYQRPQQIPYQGPRGTSQLLKQDHPVADVLVCFPPVSASLLGVSEPLRLPCLICFGLSFWWIRYSSCLDNFCSHFTLIGLVSFICDSSYDTPCISKSSAFVTISLFHCSLLLVSNGPSYQ
jgi:hypothetical protein